jgi:anti-sigma B factor antagonist
MQLEMTQSGETSKIKLNGRLDTPGVGVIETRFTASVVATGRNAVVDLSQVTFVSSMGIRMLLTTARSLGLKKAKMILFGAQPLVLESLGNAGVVGLIAYAETESLALAMLQPA